MVYKLYWLSFRRELGPEPLMTAPALRAQDERARWFLFSCIDQLMLIIMGIGEDDEKTGKVGGSVEVLDLGAKCHVFQNCAKFSFMTIVMVEMVIVVQERGS